MTTSITKSEIFTAYNKARAAARKAGNNPKEIERLNKALGILQSKDYYTSTDRDLYMPSPAACGCKDWQFHTSAKRGYAGECKHMKAEQLAAAIMASREPVNVTAYFEAMAEQKDNADLFDNVEL